MPVMQHGLPDAQANASFAALLVVAAATLSAVDAVLVRLVSDEVHPFVIVFFRSVFGLLAFAPWIVTHRAILNSRYRTMHVARAVVKLLSLVAFYAAFAVAGLADVTAIMFTAPIFLTIGAVIFLGERLGLARISAVLFGFIGAIIIVQPTADSASPALLLALLGAGLIALAQLMLKSMSDRDSTNTLVAWNLIYSVPVALLPALYLWTTPSMDVFGLLILQGVLGAINMALMTRAFSLADASLLAPIDFLRLPVVGLLGFIFFAEVPGLTTWVGGFVILISTFVVSGGGRIRRLLRPIDQ